MVLGDKGGEISKMKHKLYQKNCYEFNLNGLTKVKTEIKNEKISKILSIIMYGTMVVLLFYGIIGEKFIINYVTCMGTSKYIKFMMSG